MSPVSSKNADRFNIEFFICEELYFTNSYKRTEYALMIINPETDNCQLEILNVQDRLYFNIIDSIKTAVFICIILFVSLFFINSFINQNFVSHDKHQGFI